MKQSAYLDILLLLTVLVPVSASDKFPNVPDSLAVKFEKNVQTWMDAYNGGHASDLIPLYAEEAQYISGHVNGLVADGRTRVIAYFQQGMDGGGHIDLIELLSVEFSCDLAVLVCRYEATNSGQKASGRNMLVLRKTGDRWLIVTHMTVVLN